MSNSSSTVGHPESDAGKGHSRTKHISENGPDRQRDGRFRKALGRRDALVLGKITGQRCFSATESMSGRAALRLRGRRKRNGSAVGIRGRPQGSLSAGSTIRSRPRPETFSIAQSARPRRCENGRDPRPEMLAFEASRGRYSGLASASGARGSSAPCAAFLPFLCAHWCWASWNDPLWH